MAAFNNFVPLLLFSQHILTRLNGWWWNVSRFLDKSSVRLSLFLGILNAFVLLSHFIIIFVKLYDVIFLNINFHNIKLWIYLRNIPLLIYLNNTLLWIYLCIILLWIYLRYILLWWTNTRATIGFETNHSTVQVNFKIILALKFKIVYFVKVRKTFRSG